MLEQNATARTLFSVSYLKISKENFPEFKEKYNLMNAKDSSKIEVTIMHRPDSMDLFKFLVDNYVSKEIDSSDLDVVFSVISSSRIPDSIKLKNLQIVKKYNKDVAWLKEYVKYMPRDPYITEFLLRSNVKEWQIFTRLRSVPYTESLEARMSIAIKY